MRSGLSAPFKPPRFIKSDTSQTNGNDTRNRTSLANNNDDDKILQKSLTTGKQSRLKSTAARGFAPLRPTKQATTNNIVTQNNNANDPGDRIKEGLGGKRYIVQYRKVTNKKNKTWEGDGILEVSDQLVLKIDKKKFVRPLTKIDGIIKISGYEIEIDCETGDLPINLTSSNPSSSQSGDLQSSSSSQEVLKAPTGRLKRPFTKLSSTQLANTTSVKKPKSPPLYKLNDDSFVMRKLSVDDKDVIIDPNLCKYLRPHQREGVSFLYEGVMGFHNTNGVLLADEMGLGKTLMTITLIWTLLKQSPNVLQKSVASKILIVCPVTLINNWKKEFKKWLNLNQLGILVVDSKSDLKNFKSTRVYQILIMSYEKLHNCEIELSEIPFNLLICDEGHKLKNNTNKSLKILKNLDIDKKILLSGTPIQNNLTEFFTLIDFLNPGILGTFNQFQKQFIRPIEQSRDVNCYNKEILAKGEEVSSELSNLTNKFILRRTNDVLSKYLGDKTDVLIFVKPTEFQLNLFNKVLTRVSYSNENALNLINLFKKICNSPKLIENDNLFTSLNINLQHELNSKDNNLPIASGKINLLIALMIEIYSKNEKLVLISNYTKTLDIFANICSKLNYNYLRLDGSTNSKNRSTIISQFNNTKFPHYPVFLLSSKSGGFGINLIGASRLILFDNDWNPATDLQSMSRIYRDGQTKPVFIYRFFTTGCIDEKIFQRQLMKTNLSDAFLDNGSSSNVFGMDDLKDLFTVVDTQCNTHDLLECGCRGDGQNSAVEITEQSDSESDMNDGLDDWIPASEFKELPKKKTIQLALNDYKHLNNNYNDEILDKVKKNGITYVFTKYSNPSEENKENV